MAEVKNGSKSDVVTWSGIKGWLPLLLIVVSLVGGWVTMGYQIKETNIALANLTVEYRAHMVDVNAQKVERDSQYLKIQVTLAEIQKDLLYIRQEIESGVVVK
jgi:hypothetical protein